MRNEDVLHGHMRTHLMGASGGTAAFERVAHTHGIPEVAQGLKAMAEEIKQERDWLREMMADVGIEPSAVSRIASQGAEAFARFRPTPRLIGRSDLMDVLELEALYAAVVTKRNGWRLMRQAARAGANLDIAQLDELERWADSQLERLADWHALTAAQKFPA